MTKATKFLIGCFICLIGLYSCSSHKTLIKTTFEKKLASEVNSIYNLTIKPNTKLLLSTDNFDINSITEQAGLNLVLKFEYQTLPPKNLADANYREVLFVEIPNAVQKIDLTNIDNVNIWFARFCFCKDYVGFYKVNPDTFELNLNKNQLIIKSEFKLYNLPRVLNFIDQNISLKQ